MNFKELIEKMKYLGFTENEAKCYLMLLKKDSLGVGEIAKLGEVPRPNAYNALERLLAKGLVVSHSGKVISYSASDPLNLKDKLMMDIDNSIESELREWEKKGEEIRERKNSLHEGVQIIAGYIEDIYKENRGSSELSKHIELMIDPQQIDKIFFQLIMNVKKEVLSMARQNFGNMTEKRKRKIQKDAEYGTSLIKKDIIYKCIYGLSPDEAQNQFMCKYAIDKFVTAGEQARVMKDIPMRVTIFDEEVVMFTLIDSSGSTLKIPWGPQNVTQLVRNKVTAKSFKVMFNSLWDMAEDYQDYKKRVNMKY